MEYQADSVERVTKEAYNVLISFEVDGNGVVKDGDTNITYQELRDGLKLSVEPEVAEVESDVDNIDDNEYSNGINLV